MIATLNRKIHNVLVKLRQRLFSGPFKGYENADQVVRYIPIAEEIMRSGVSNPTILEIGSGVKGITSYIPFRITGIDTSFDGEINSNLNAVYFSGTKLPFENISYDYVISVDMLEHVSEKMRFNFIYEIIRVAKKKVIIAVPCGRIAERQDCTLDRIYLQQRGEFYTYLHEHTVNGLPDGNDIVANIIAAAGKYNKNIKIKSVSNFNIYVRYLMMRLWVDQKYYPLYLLFSLVVCLLRKYVSFGLCYRKIFIVDILDVAK
jgi:hypothetical protein